MTVATDYLQFLDDKAAIGHDTGLQRIPELNPRLFPFQRDLVTWALKRGRAALFEDCGLGKTPQQLVWADVIARTTNKPVLILTPLAVAHQTLSEAEKFGIEAARSYSGEITAPNVIANYERLHYFNPDDFSGLVCDESSILKNFSGETKKAVTEFSRKLPYRLLCTATAAPNDYHELGTSSEALSYLGYMDMLTHYFINERQNAATNRMHGRPPKWRFKGHAELPFWRWVCSWARALRKPSDLGYNDDAFVLPPLSETEHIVKARSAPPGRLFSVVATNLEEEREERRRTIAERCEMVASLVQDTGKPALVWCHLNDEADLIERLIPDAQQVSGSQSDELKEERLTAFARGELRVLVTKPKIGAWGLNLQHCAHIVQFPSHSYEQYYQGIRRCWRFGQQQPVQVDILTTEGEVEVLRNLRRKAEAADRMFSSLIAEMNRAIAVDHRRTFTQAEVVPAWL